MIKRLDRIDTGEFVELITNYPLFEHLGVQARMDEVTRSVYLRIPFEARWRNNNNTFFGGVMLMVSDPFPALLMEQYFPGSSAWTISHGIAYLKPVRSAVEMRFELDDILLDTIENELSDKGSCRGSFEYYFYDTRERRVAKVTSEYYLRVPSLMRKQK